MNTAKGSSAKPSLLLAVRGSTNEVVHHMLRTASIMHNHSIFRIRLAPLSDDTPYGRLRQILNTF